jgi:hypothetical protein
MDYSLALSSPNATLRGNSLFIIGGIITLYSFHHSSVGVKEIQIFFSTPRYSAFMGTIHAYYLPYCFFWSLIVNHLLANCSIFLRLIFFSTYLLYDTQFLTAIIWDVRLGKSSLIH